MPRSTGSSTTASGTGSGAVGSTSVWRRWRPLEAGRALDLGCGEGADACWLAERGWSVVAVDISDTALQRAAAAAETRGVSDRIEFVQHDLSDTFPDGTFDLISAQFLHSMIPFDRPRVLETRRGRGPPGWDVADRRPRRAAALGVEAGPPPRIPQRRGGCRRHCNLDDDWERVRVEAVERQAIGPDGESARGWTT